MKRLLPILFVLMGFAASYAQIPIQLKYKIECVNGDTIQDADCDICPPELKQGIPFFGARIEDPFGRSSYIEQPYSAKARGNIVVITYGENSDYLIETIATDFATSQQIVDTLERCPFPPGDSVGLITRFELAQDSNIIISIRQPDGKDRADTADLRPAFDDTDQQNLSLSGDLLSIDRGTGVDLSPYLDNTDDQALSLNENELTLENGGTPIDLSVYLDFVGAENGLSSYLIVDTTYVKLGGQLNENTSIETTDLFSLSISTEYLSGDIGAYWNASENSIDGYKAGALSDDAYTIWGRNSGDGNPRIYSSTSEGNTESVFDQYHHGIKIGVDSSGQRVSQLWVDSLFARLSRENNFFAANLNNTAIWATNPGSDVDILANDDFEVQAGGVADIFSNGEIRMQSDLISLRVPDGTGFGIELNADLLQIGQGIPQNDTSSFVLTGFRTALASDTTYYRVAKRSVASILDEFTIGLTEDPNEYKFLVVDDLDDVYYNDLTDEVAQWNEAYAYSQNPTIDLEAVTDNGAITSNNIVIESVSPRLRIREDSEPTFDVRGVGGELRFGTSTGSRSQAALVLRQGASADAFFNGRLGISELSPIYQLEVKGSGDIGLQGTANTNLYLRSPGGSGNSLLWWIDSGGGLDFYFGQLNENGPLVMYNYLNSKQQAAFFESGDISFAANLLYVDDSESGIGVGTSVPTATLDINGGLRVRTITEDNTLFKIGMYDDDGNLFQRNLSSIGDDITMPPSNLTQEGADLNDALRWNGTIWVAQPTVNFLSESDTITVCNTGCDYSSLNQALEFGSQYYPAYDSTDGIKRLTILIDRNSDNSKAVFSNGFYIQGGDYSNITLTCPDTSIFNPNGTSEIFLRTDQCLPPQIQDFTIEMDTFGRSSSETNRFYVSTRASNIYWNNVELINFNRAFEFSVSTSIQLRDIDISGTTSTQAVSFENAVARVDNLHISSLGVTSDIPIALKRGSVVSMSNCTSSGWGLYGISLSDSQLFESGCNFRSDGSTYSSEDVHFFRNSIIVSSSSNLPGESAIAINRITPSGIYISESEPIPFQESTTIQEPSASSGINFYYNTTENQPYWSDGVDWNSFTPDLLTVLSQGTDAGANQITNLADPTADQDAATKAYVDDATTDVGEYSFTPFRARNTSVSTTPTAFFVHNEISTFAHDTTANVTLTFNMTGAQDGAAVKLMVYEDETFVGTLGDFTLATTGSTQFRYLDGIASTYTLVNVPEGTGWLELIYDDTNDEILVFSNF